MIIETPPLSVKNVNVFPALFKAQLPETLNALRQAIPDWTAVHVTADAAGLKRGPTKEEMCTELIAQLKPLAALYDPIYRLTNPELPPNTLFTLVPDRVKPSFTSEYELWKFIYYKESRGLLKQLFESATGGMPDPSAGLADTLVKGKIKGQAVLEGWTGSIGVPGFKRTMEAILDPKGRVMFWDGSFGFEATGQTFLATSEMVLGQFGAKSDRLYFDATNFSWFVCFYPGGQMRVGLLG